MFMLMYCYFDNNHQRDNGKQCRYPSASSSMQQVVQCILYIVHCTMYNLI